jgi:hypothetical protein
MLDKKSNRTDWIRDYAVSRGMEFRDKDTFRMITYLRGFGLFRQGGRRRISNICIYKSDLYEYQFRTFDYEYTISTGKTSRTYRQTVFMAMSKETGMPGFRLQPENVFHRIGSFLGMQDIDFENFPGFSKSYLLRGEEEDLIRDYFTDDILHYFSEEPGWHLEALNFYFILYKNDKLLDRHELESLFHKGSHIHGLFKGSTFALDLESDDSI